MRVLTVPPGPWFSVVDVHRGWTKAIKALVGSDRVLEWPFDAALSFYETAKDACSISSEEAVLLASRTVEQMAFRWWPDLVVVTSAFYLPVDTLDVFRDRGMTVAMIHTESPYEDNVQVARAGHADINIVNDPTNLDRFPPGTIYLPHAYDPDIHHPGDGARAGFCFVGTGYPSRIDWLSRVDWPDVDVTIAGNWQGLDDDHPLRKHIDGPVDDCLDNVDTADMYRRAAASLNLYRLEANHDTLTDGWAMGPREVELAACGCFYLTQERGENRDVLPMVPVAGEPEEFGDQLAWWLAHDTERADVTAAAQAAVADRTFTANAKRLLNLVP